MKKIFFVLICIACFSEAVYGQTNSLLKLKSRLKVSGEIDNNIGEDYNNGMSDKALKIFSNLEASGVFSNKTYYKVSMNSGFRMYSVYERENRFVGNIKGNISKSLPNNILIGINGVVYYDKYNENSRNNNSYLGEGYISIPKSIVFLGDIDLYYQNLESNYVHDDFYNFSESCYSISMGRKVNNRTSLSVFTRLGERDYKRNAFDKKGNNNFFYKDVAQNDRSNEIGINFQYFRKFLIQTILLHRNNISNSYGFSYIEKKLSVIFGRKMLRNYMLKLYFDIESKRYKDPGEMFVIVDLNEDKEQDNRSIVELSRSINENIDFEVRMEWSHNESRFRNLYYSKYLFSTGFLYKFY